MVVERVLILKCDGASALIRMTMDVKFEHEAVSMVSQMPYRVYKRSDTPIQPLNWELQDENWNHRLHCVGE